MSRHYLGVVGNPINHSLSPEIHNNFAKENKIDIQYSKILANDDNFSQTVINFFNNDNYTGLNITVPFKTKAYKLVNRVSEKSLITKTVNTIIKDKKEIIGTNTDGIGLMQDLTKNIKYNIENKSILIIGAGGAASSIIYDLLLAKPKIILIANRTEKKAIKLAKQYKEYGELCGFSIEKIKNENIDVIINTTSVHLSGGKLNLPVKLAANAFCYDLMYGHQTDFMNWAKKFGATIVSDGIGMLVEQAAAAFELWFNIKISTNTTHKKIKELISHKIK